jgi:hypothetical protein
MTTCSPCEKSGNNGHQIWFHGDASAAGQLANYRLNRELEKLSVSCDQYSALLVAGIPATLNCP